MDDYVTTSDHSYTSVVTAPTCTEGGYTTYTCTAGGDSYTDDEVAAKGHSYTGVVTAPTCTEGGYTTYTCACGDSYIADEVAAAGHSYAGGSCTVCGAADPGASDNETEDDPIPTGKITLKSVTLSLEDEIKYNLYYEVSDMTVTEANMGLLVWDSEPARATINGGGTAIPGSVYVPTSGRYMVTSMGIPAKNMGDLKYLVVYAKLADGSYVYSDVLTYSAKTYCLSRLEKSSDENLKSLCVALMNFGAAAQEYFAATTDYTYTELMNVGFEDYQSLVKPYESGMMAARVTVDKAKAGTFGTEANGFTKRTASMSAEGTFSINYYFTTSAVVENVTMYYWTEEAYNAADVLTAANASGTVAMSPTENANQFWASYDGIPAKEMDKNVFVCGVYELDGVTYYTGVIAYSLGHYCTTKAASGGEDVKPFAEATAVYGYYAKAYFTSSTV